MVLPDEIHQVWSNVANLVVAGWDCSDHEQSKETARLLASLARATRQTYGVVSNTLHELALAATAPDKGWTAKYKGRVTRVGAISQIMFIYTRNFVFTPPDSMDSAVQTKYAWVSRVLSNWQLPLGLPLCLYGPASQSTMQRFCPARALNPTEKRALTDAFRPLLTECHIVTNPQDFKGGDEYEGYTFGRKRKRSCAQL